MRFNLRAGNTALGLVLLAAGMASGAPVVMASDLAYPPATARR